MIVVWDRFIMEVFRVRRLVPMVGNRKVHRSNKGTNAPKPPPSKGVKQRQHLTPRQKAQAFVRKIYGREPTPEEIHVSAEVLSNIIEEFWHTASDDDFFRLCKTLNALETLL